VLGFATQTRVPPKYAVKINARQNMHTGGLGANLYLSRFSGGRASDNAKNIGVFIQKN
jgi:hypothetical protein